MPVGFEVRRDEGFFISRHEGPDSDAGIMAAYRNFLEGSDWIPGLNELADLSEADWSELSADGMRALSLYASKKYRESGLELVRTAVYAPDDLPFGIARMYEVFASESSPERVRVFRSRSAALSWLRDPPDERAESDETE